MYSNRSLLMPLSGRGLASISTAGVDCKIKANSVNAAAFAFARSSEGTWIQQRSSRLPDTRQQRNVQLYSARATSEEFLRLQIPGIGLSGLPKVGPNSHVIALVTHLCDHASLCSGRDGTWVTSNACNARNQAIATFVDHHPDCRWQSCSRSGALYCCPCCVHHVLLVSLATL